MEKFLKLESVNYYIKFILFSNLNGNGQVTESEIIQVEHYYPFGMKQEGHGNVTISENNYRYNDKELVGQDFELDLYDYGARWYDASVGRWHGVDPLAEAFIVYSPYNYGDKIQALFNPLYAPNNLQMGTISEPNLISTGMQSNSANVWNSFNIRENATVTNAGTLTYTVTNSNPSASKDDWQLSVQITTPYTFNPKVINIAVH